MRGLCGQNSNASDATLIGSLYGQVRLPRGFFARARLSPDRSSRRMGAMPVTDLIVNVGQNAQRKRNILSMSTIRLSSFALIVAPNSAREDSHQFNVIVGIKLRIVCYPDLKKTKVSKLIKAWAPSKLTIELL